MLLGKIGRTKVLISIHLMIIASCCHTVNCILSVPNPRILTVREIAYGLGLKVKILKGLLKRKD